MHSTVIAESIVTFAAMIADFKPKHEIVTFLVKIILCTPNCNNVVIEKC